MCLFFNDTATTEIYTLSLHDALPIWAEHHGGLLQAYGATIARLAGAMAGGDIYAPDEALLAARLARADRKSTRLNSSHANISYAVFCLTKKQKGRKSSSRHARCSTSS